MLSTNSHKILVYKALYIGIAVYKVEFAYTVTELNRYSKIGEQFCGNFSFVAVCQ